MWGATVTIDQTPPASTLLYLFAEQVMPPDKALSVGVEVPCAGVKVQRAPLVTGLFSIALWHLRQHGLVTLEYQERKRMMITTRQVLVTPAGAGPTGGPLEGQLMGVLVSAGPRSVKDLVYQWFGEDVSDPYARVLAIAQQAAVALGAFAEVDAERGAVGSFLLGKTKYVPVCERREELRGAANDVLGGWNSFRTAEQQLAGQIEESAKKAVTNRTERDDDLD